MLALLTSLWYRGVSMKGGYFMRTILIILAVVDFLVIAWLWDSALLQVPNFDIIVCNGGYQVGDSCKKDPTGCQYADSLPTDLCEKANPESIPDSPMVINWNLAK